MIRIGIIREGKIPIDRRVPITPDQAIEIQQDFEVEVICQPSPHRCYEDSEYQSKGITISDDLTDCDILFGVKEVPIDDLIPNKTYFFFSHTIKAQPYNRDLLRAILQKKIRLIDYEMLFDTSGRRVVAFGRYAGIVGAYNAIWTYGKRYNLFDIKRAHDCRDLDEMRLEFKKVKLPPVKIVLTGGGRVGKGAMEVLFGMGLKKVSPKELRKKQFKKPVFAQLNSRDYYKSLNGDAFHRSDFFRNCEKYKGDFLKYAKKADILIAGAYWDPKAPVLFTREDMVKPSFSLRVIADITCDIEGSIPSTKEATTILDPVYDYNPSEDVVERAHTDEANISVMAVDNLPAELPRDASIDFGRDLITHCLPNLFENDRDGMINNASITIEGLLNERYSYLQSFVDEEQIDK